MKPFLAFVLALLLTPQLAQATDYKHPIPPTPSPTSQADSTSQANALSTSNAQAGAGASIDYYSAGARSYALFSGGAAPLPATTCPKGDSSYLQIGWGLLTVASSTTRTEMECLEKVLSAMKAQPLPVPPKLPMTDQIHPPAPSVTPTGIVLEKTKPNNGAGKKATKGSTAAGTTIRKDDSGCKRVTSNDGLKVTCAWT